MGKRIKYMGSADVAVITAGHDFNGQLGKADTAVPNRIEWNWENRHTVDWDDTGASDAALKLLLEDTDRYKDVSDLELIPTSLGEQLWQAMPASEVDQETIPLRAGLSAQPTVAEQVALLAPDKKAEDDESPPATNPVDGQADEVATRSPEAVVETDVVQTPDPEADPEPKAKAPKAQ